MCPILGLFLRLKGPGGALVVSLRTIRLRPHIVFILQEVSSGAAILFYGGRHFVLRCHNTNLCICDKNNINQPLIGPEVDYNHTYPP